MKDLPAAKAFQTASAIGGFFPTALYRTLHSPNKCNFPDQKDCNMAYTQLTSEQRYCIAKHYRNPPLRQIAQTIGYRPATVGHEIRRNSINGTYCCRQTDHRRSDYPQVQLRTSLIHLFKHQGIRLHHSTIYRYLLKDHQNGGRLPIHLRIVSKPYCKTYGDAWTKSKVPDRTGIEHRPAIVAQKERIGDFEMGTIVGKDRKSRLLVGVERKTKFTAICKITSFKAQDVARAAVQALKPFKDMVQTITPDNGKEFCRHASFAKAWVRKPISVAPTILRKKVWWRTPKVSGNEVMNLVA